MIFLPLIFLFHILSSSIWSSLEMNEMVNKVIYSIAQSYFLISQNSIFFLKSVKLYFCNKDWC